MPMGPYNNWTPNNNWNNNWNNNRAWNQPRPQFNNNINNISQQQPVDNILRVAGPESANAYPLPEKSNIVLFDANNPMFYWKTTDDNGYPYPLRAFKFEEVKINESQSTNDTDTSMFATKEDLATLQNNVFEIKQMLEGLVN